MSLKRVASPFIVSPAGFHVVPFIRVYRDRSDYGTWFNRPEVAQMIEDEWKRRYGVAN